MLRTHVRRRRRQSPGTRQQTTPVTNSTPSHTLTMAGALKRFIPLFDRVLVQKAEPITKTGSGILIPEKSIAKVLMGKVMAVGEGSRTETGAVVPPAVAVGDEVLLPEFGGTKVTLEEKDYYLYRDSEILAKLKNE